MGFSDGGGKRRAARGGNPFSRTLTQPYAAGLWPAQTPAYTPATYTGLHGMDPTLPFTVTVNQFVPHPAASGVVGGYFINVDDEGDYGAFVTAMLATGSGASATSRTIPANTLEPGTSYIITWMFAHDVTSSTGGPGVTETQFRAATRVFFTTAGGSACGSADFDGDGDTGTDADAFFACLGGSCCATCFEGGADFNGDGDTGTDADIESFFRVLGGGEC